MDHVQVQACRNQNARPVYLPVVFK
jgi:hypothetical protein